MARIGLVVHEAENKVVTNQQGWEDVSDASVLKFPLCTFMNGLLIGGADLENN